MSRVKWTLEDLLADQNNQMKDKDLLGVQLDKQE